MRRWLPSHLRRFPLKYKTWLASAESIDPKRDRLVESHLTKSERSATRPFDLRSSCGKIRFFVLIQSYYHFSSSVYFFHIPDSIRNLTQAVTPGHDRSYF